MRELPRHRRPGWSIPGGVLATALLLFAGLAGAQPAPAECTRSTLGQLSCQAGVRCECGYVRESAMSDTPAGYRWDCGIERPRCDAPPATLDPWMGPYPSSLGIDRTTIYEYPYPHERPSRR